jgi:hypothetical protein
MAVIWQLCLAISILIWFIKSLPWITGECSCQELIPKIYTLRSNDYPADEGVLPGEEEQKKYQMTVQAINQP